MREACLSPKLVQDIVAAALGRPARRTRPPCRGLESRCVQGPSGFHFFVAGEDSVAELHRCDGEALAWAHGVGSHPVDDGGEDRVPVAALLALVYDAKRLVDCENLGVEDLLVYAEIEVAAGSATG